MFLGTVAVLDQGVDHDLLASFGFKVGEEVIICDDKAAGVRDVKDLARLSHGTSIVRIIARICPAENILSVKLVTNGNLVVDLLCKGLEFCASRTDIRVINISLGILQKQPNRELYRLCKHCHDLGKIIVAAAHFSLNQICYPAGFRFVYGVGVGMARRLTEYRYLGNGYINVLAKGVHQRVVSENGSEILRGGTSYAAAAFSGTVMKLLMENQTSSRGGIRKILYRHSTNMVSAHGCRKAVRPMKKVLPRELQGKICLLFGTDDPAIAALGGSGFISGFVLKYPVNPGNRFDCSTYRNWRPIDGALSRKLCNQVDALILGNFFLNPLLLNTYFGLLLIELVLLTGKPVFVTERRLQPAIDDLARMKELPLAASDISYLPVKTKGIHLGRLSIV